MAGKKAPKPLSAADAAKKEAAALEKAQGALWKAIKDDRLANAEKAIAAGAKVDAVEEVHGQSLMHRAAGFGALHCIKLLHAHGASIEVKNNKGKTPADLAADVGEEVAAKLLCALAQGLSGDDLIAGNASDDDIDEEVPGESSDLSMKEVNNALEQASTEAPA